MRVVGHTTDAILLLENEYEPNDVMLVHAAKLTPVIEYVLNALLLIEVTLELMLIYPDWHPVLVVPETQLDASELVSSNEQINNNIINRNPGILN